MYEGPTMITLLDERFAPTTSTIGFLRVDLTTASDALATWLSGLGSQRQVRRHDLHGDLPRMLQRLSPLTGGTRPRRLLVATQNPEWTAYFDCGLTGTDAESAIGHLSRVLSCEGMYVSTVPHTIGTAHEQPGRYGAAKLVMFGPKGTEPLGYVRVVSVVHDGSRWVFDEDGDPQPFEDTERYKSRRIRDRFDSAKLAQYCASLGLHPFVEDFYGSSGTLIEHLVDPAPGGKAMAYQDAQRWLGVQAGLAQTLPG